MKKISIIIATYNAEKYISRCITSIVSQKSENIELIIIDGNSKDNTIHEIKKFGNAINLLISEPDKGIYDAWNKGIKQATGQWIQFIGADDILLPDAVKTYEKIIEGKELSNVDLVSAKCRYVDVNGKFLTYYGEAYSWYTFRKYMNISHGSSLHNKNLFHKIGDYNLDFKICADYELLLRKKDKLVTQYIDIPTLEMQTGGMSWTIKAIKESYEIRKFHNTISSLRNKYIYFKGVIVFWKMKLRWGSF